jgi:hypothetical protein
VSVEEAGAAQDGVADAAEVAALERPPGALEHGAVRSGAARDDLVGRERGPLISAPAGLRPPPPPRLGRYPHRRRLRHPGRRGGGGSGGPRALLLLLLLVLRERGEEPEPAGARAGSRGRRARGGPRRRRGRGRGSAGGRAGGGPWRLLREPSPVRQISGDVAALEFVHGRWDGRERERERAREGGRGGGRAAVIEGGLVAFLVLQTGPS